MQERVAPGWPVIWPSRLPVIPGCGWRWWTAIFTTRDCTVTCGSVRRTYDTLHDGADTVKERMKTTALPNLSVVTTGKPPTSRAFPTDPLDVGRILQRLLCQFSIVIVDTAPVLTDTAAAAIASQCDGTILVVHAEHTRREVAQDAQARLQQAGANILGAVLNQRQFPIPEFLYRRL